MKQICSVVVLALSVSFGMVSPTQAKPKAEWNQIANVKDAAKRLGELHRRHGSEAALKFLEACYKTHMLAEKYTEGLESCMAQDYMLSQVLAVIYSRVPEGALKDMKAPSAEIISRSMRGRFQAIFLQYKLTQEQADGLKKAVDEFGMPIFVKTVFPKRPNDGGKGKDDTGKGGGDVKEAPPPPMIPLPDGKPGDKAPSAQPPAGEPK